MDEVLLNLFLSQIKSKSQINDLENEFILDRLNKFFLTNGDVRKSLELEFINKSEKIIKSKKFKEVVKQIRKEIGIVYGSFLTSNFSKKEKILDVCDNLKESFKLLKLHKSTRERVDFYDEIYTKIFNWYLPKKIGDLACGLNPVSYCFISDKFGMGVKYFASDLNPADMTFLNLY